MAPKLTDELPVVITIRITNADAEALDALLGKHRLARRAAVAREALRRGLAEMQAEAARTKGGQ